MCGIAGAFSRDLPPAVAADMATGLCHRGPDDDGAVVLSDSGGAPAGAFAHRRLSVLDLTRAGHQPMGSEDGRYVLSYNGEIYNFRELRAELESAGVTFSSTSDTEVLLAGWALHGPSFLRRLDGMFAFGLWDRNRGRGWLARDPFGIKPLYVAHVGASLLFASELRPLLASGRVRRRLSMDAVRTFLATGSVAEPLTIIDGVFSVPAGTIIEVVVGPDGARASEPASYGAATLEPAGDCVSDQREAARIVRRALQDSTERHLVSDVPVALFLSGGIDSSAVAGLASEVSGKRLDTFTVTFAEQEYCEAGPAGALARRFGTRHHEIPVSGDELLLMLPDAFAAMDQPSLDGLNTYAVSRAVRAQGIKVVLSGLGGDELFAGYPSFRRAQQLERLPRAAARMAAVGAGRVGGVRGEKLNVLFGGGAPAWAAYRASRTLFGDLQVADLTGSNGTVTPPCVPGGLSLLQQVSWYELTGYMRNTLLRDSDVFSMAHGLELRVPFVDREVAQASARVHDRLKLSRRMRKPALVRAVADLLPPAAYGRPKKGFTLPFQRWLHRELRGELESGFTAGAFERVGIRPAAGRAVWTDFLDNRAGVNWSRPWALYTLIRWASQNDVAVAADATDAAALAP
jgi:asparagine synthase (glutamine-hydrolysing)